MTTTTIPSTHTAARAVVDALLAAGVDHAFCVPGESFLGLLDALYDEPRIRLIATRHEGGAAFMAEAYAKLTHRPTVCMGTRMVGGGNLSIGIHTAQQDSSPVIALFGQVATAARYREAFQEAELAHVFAPLTKWAVEPPSADRVGELVTRAARVAVSGRRGPVAVALREDLLTQPAGEPNTSPIHPPKPAPEPGLAQQTLALLREAERPVLILGEEVLAADATDLYRQIAEHEGVPVMAAWRRPDVFPNDQPLYLGMSGLSSPPCVARRLREADVVVAVGTRLDEYTTFEYSIPTPAAKLVHVSLDPETLGGTRIPDVACLADAALFADTLLAAARSNPPAAMLLGERSHRNAADRARWEGETTPSRGKARPGFVDQQWLVAELRRTLPADTITVTDAGNFSGWPARYLRWQQPGTFLGPISGAMGYGVPAAIAAKLARPLQPVLGFVGDGGFLMTGSEIQTAAREHAPVVLLVYDNQQYGTIRMHQLREYPGRQVATALGSFDAAAYARALGGLGFTVRDEADVAPALAEALHADKPSVLHLAIDPEQISVAQDA